MIEKVIKTITAIAPFLAPYSISVKVLFSVWVFLFALLFLALIFLRPEEALSPKQQIEQPEDSQKDLTKVTIRQDERPRAIINILETGQPRAPYTLVITLFDDLRYGSTFASLERGELHALLQAYINFPNAKFNKDIESYMDRVDQKDSELTKDKAFIRLLEKAGGEDPAMVTIQDAFWRTSPYQIKSEELAEAIGVRSALGTTILMDTIIHRGPNQASRAKDKTIKKLHGSPITGVNEHDWLKEYLQVRDSSMPDHLKKYLLYRTELFTELIASDSWDLSGDITVKNFLFTE